MARSYSIGELAREFGVSIRTIRHYEDEGLLAPLRDGQRRIFSQRDRTRLALVLRGRRLGFSLAEAREIIDLYSAPQGEAGQLRVLLDRLAEKRSELAARRRDLDASIDNMDRYAARCRQRLADLEAGREPGDGARAAR
jgi:DNA-binding transcriptional MerR regulator